MHHGTTAACKALFTKEVHQDSGLHFRFRSSLSFF
jgi:hypothetical protein